MTTPDTVLVDVSDLEDRYPLVDVANRLLGRLIARDPDTAARELADLEARLAASPAHRRTAR